MKKSTIVIGAVALAVGLGVARVLGGLVKEKHVDFTDADLQQYPIVAWVPAGGDFVEFGALGRRWAGVVDAVAPNGDIIVTARDYHEVGSGSTRATVVLQGPATDRLVAGYQGPAQYA